MLRKDWQMLKGNDRFEGFAVDLMEYIADNLGFEYELYLVPDGKFGSKLSTGEWNGMVGEVLSGVSYSHSHMFVKSMHIDLSIKHRLT